MLPDNFKGIKIRIAALITDRQRLGEENERLWAQIHELEQSIKQMEDELFEIKEKYQGYDEIEKENQQFKLHKETLQKSIDQLIEELKDL